MLLNQTKKIESYISHQTEEWANHLYSIGKLETIELRNLFTIKNSY